MARIGLDPANVQLAAHLVDDLDLDSLDWVDLAIQLEEALSIDLREERFTSVRTVQDVVDCAYAALVAVDRAEE
jgi:acyl carrier protein